MARKRPFGAATLLAATAALLLLTGCRSPGLMAAPNLFVNAPDDPFADVPEVWQSNKIDVLYATDRMAQPAKDGRFGYGYARNRSLAFGAAEVVLGDDVPWDVLKSESVAAVRTVSLAPQVAAVSEALHLPPPNNRYDSVDGRIVLREDIRRAEAEVAGQIAAMLRERLQHTPQKDVFLFVHGYNVNFDQALVTIAQIWHFIGRVGVPMAYSWPAGRGGIRGYTADRESGEFTVFHLKQCLRMLAATPELNRIHIIGHSRGTDVVLTALRELHLELADEAGGMRDALKLGRIVLAAPDLDLQVAGQRISAEGLLYVPERFTIYLSTEDRAIGLSTWLFDSVRRIGKLQSSDLAPEAIESLKDLPEVEFIDARTKRTDFFDHSYFYQNPAVSSDLILNLRDDKDAGAAGGRPLRQTAPGFWQLENDYPQFADTP